MSSQTANNKSQAGPKLTRKSDYPAWIAALQFFALSRGTWDEINLIMPNPAKPSRKFVSAADIPTYETARQELVDRAKKRVEAWEKDISPSKGKRPITEPTEGQIYAQLDTALKQFKIAASISAEERANYKETVDWIQNTVDPEIMSSIQKKCRNEGDVSLRSVLRMIHARLAPSVMEPMIRDHYVEF
ncbi:uncharacterized protein GGS22DRAFT_175640 [Annulohypoxylon maeteangense]|uniref:uncharacterized protein n=1 Tax=Annulohypoxylon maeteangense TaxID=1927788 RepID=UPI00200730CD|nr:uncharacterized protein GGS22DRAFT_175640 [Annulohypoxylon maeteangense]KAI0880284.1 hypothetical protein GGS22DRAFT_175640 [Annulohypoxylon maeteangense]